MKQKPQNTKWKKKKNKTKKFFIKEIKEVYSNL